MDGILGRRRYPLAEAFNLLIIFTPTVGILQVDHFVLEGIFFLQLFNVRHTQDIFIGFHANKIIYKVEEFEHCITNQGTIDYIYYLISMGTAAWMKEVTERIFKKTLHSLVVKTAWNTPYIPHCYESTFRRYLTKPLTILRHVRTLKNYARYQSSPYHASVLRRRKIPGSEPDMNMYLKYGLSIPTRYRETIYMHDLNMYGDYSQEYNRFIMPYMLIIECVLDPRHRWYCIDEYTHFCRIEEYSFFLRRYRFWKNIKVYIFLDSDINRFTAHPLASSIGLSSWVNNPKHMSPFLLEFERNFINSFIFRKFYLRWNNFTVFPLNILAKFTLVFNFFIKRIHLTVGRELSKGYISYTRGMAEENESVDQFTKWENLYHSYAQMLDLFPREFSAKRSGLKKTMTYSERIERESLAYTLHCCWKVAGMLHSEHAHAMFKLGIPYRRLGRKITSTLDKHALKLI